MLNRPIPARLGAATSAALLLTAVAAAPASAHVTITPSDTTAGAYTVLTVSVGHGCEGSPTTALDIQIPEQILSVTPTVLPGWEVEKKMVQLDQPVDDAHGTTVTERVGQVVYTADRPLPDGYRAAMELSLQLPDAAGDTLTFPVVQRCAEGETAWTETAAEGQDPEQLERPAPTVTITDAEAAEAAPASSPTTTTRTVEVESDTNVALGLAGLGAGLIGIVLALVAITRSRRET
ncbi:MAG: YcnI family protein [Actinomycetota bacterium]|nr:YcnI family protein [Actinomycetota bacterium]